MFKNSSLSARLGRLVLIALVLLCAAMIVLGEVVFSRMMSNIYVQSGSDVCDMVADRIPWDKVDEWLEGDPAEVTRDPDYAEALELMESLAKRNNLPYLLVFKAMEDGEHYIFDALKSDEQFKLGDIYTWAEDDLPDEVVSAMLTGEKIIPAYRERAHFASGLRVVSIIRGYGTEDGRTAAYVATCFSLAEFQQQQRIFSFSVAGMFLAFIAGFFIIFLRLMNRTLVAPVAELIESVTRFKLEEMGVEPSSEAHQAPTRNEVVMLQNSVFSLEAAIREYKDHLKVTKKKAETDVLTGLFNRESLITGVREYINDPGDPHAAYSFLMIDLDHFKAINDTFGHIEGDKALCRCADTLRRMFRAESAGDIVARLGGDEFAVFCTGFGDVNTLDRKLKDVHAAMAEVKLPNGKHVTMSIGAVVAEGASCGATYERMYETADTALYTAKNRGRNCHEILILHPAYPPIPPPPPKRRGRNGRQGS